MLVTPAFVFISAHPVKEDDTIRSCYTSLCPSGSLSSLTRMQSWPACLQSHPSSPSQETPKAQMAPCSSSAHFLSLKPRILPRPAHPGLPCPQLTHLGLHPSMLWQDCVAHCSAMCMLPYTSGPLHMLSLEPTPLHPANPSILQAAPPPGSLCPTPTAPQAGSVPFCGPTAPYNFHITSAWS